MTNSALPQAEAPNYQDWTGEMGTRWLANLHGLEKNPGPNIPIAQHISLIKQLRNVLHIYNTAKSLHCWFYEG